MLRLQQLVEQALSARAHLACGQGALAHRLVNITGEGLLLLGAHLLGAVPVVLIEALAGLALAAATALGLLLEVGIDHRAVPAAILVVETPHLQRPGHGGKTIGVVVNKFYVDDVVAGHVCGLLVLVIHPPPCGEVAIELVIHLVQHEEAQLLVVEALDEGPPVHLVAPVGAGGWHRVVDAASADHHDAGQRHILGVGHDCDHGFLEPLFSGQLCSEHLVISFVMRPA